MSAVLFLGAPYAKGLLAVVCYLGVVLYATSAAVRSPRRAVPETIGVAIYAAMFPLSPSLALAYVIQFSILVTAMAMIGAVQLYINLLRRRELHAYRAGVACPPMPRSLAIAILVPPVAVSAGLVAKTVLAFLASAPAWNASFDAAGADFVLANAPLKLGAAIALFSAYMAVASYLDRDWVRLVGRIRLLMADSRFFWLNILVAVTTAVALIVFVRFGVGPRESGYAALFACAAGLLPVLNGLAWIYDAVLRRVLSFHLFVAASALIAVSVKAIALPLALSPAATWTMLLGAIGLAAVTLPPWIEEGLERWLFPRAAQMRARLLAIAARPLTAATRRDAAAAILRRVADVLDAEGGAIVMHATSAEPAAIERIGSVETLALGVSAADVSRYVADLVPDARPRLMEDLRLADQLRLLDCGVSLICPMVARRAEGTLLLAPRRGWPYDDGTVRALGLLARQLGLALENLALTNAKAHGEKLEALGGAAARIAHEIRNPLAGARSLVQLLGRSDGDGLASSAVEELDRIGRLVGDLLAFARRDDAGAREPVDLAAICAEAIRETAALAADAAVEVEADLRPALVRGDRRRLVQVFANLLRNAIEALADAERPRRLAVRSSGAEDRAVVCVSDNGPGIATEERGRLFEPFRTTKSSGTGLGLPIARGIVESHGGCISVESGAGVDTVFRVELPLAEATVDSASGEVMPHAPIVSVLRRVG
jgi:signal transduction histidine kinase